MSVQDLAKLIIDYRQREKISQSEFARLCDLSAGTIGKLELMAVKPDTETLLKLSKVLQRTPEELLRIYQGLPPNLGEERKHSLPYEIYNIAAECGLDWKKLSPEGRETLIAALKLVIKMEKERQALQSPRAKERARR